jgi:hypothetical protein
MELACNWGLSVLRMPRSFQHLPAFHMSSFPVCPVCQIDMLLASEQHANLHPELQTLECGKCRLMFTRPITREDVARRAVRDA